MLYPLSYEGGIRPGNYPLWLDNLQATTALIALP